MLATGLLHIAFIMFRYIPGIHEFSKTFYNEGVLDFAKGFSPSNEIIM